MHFCNLEVGKVFLLCSLHLRTKGTSTARGCTVHMPDVRECRGPLYVFVLFFFFETSEVRYQVR